MGLDLSGNGVVELICINTVLYFRIYWRRPHSMRSRVYVTVVCPSVCLSVCPIDREQQLRQAGLLLSIQKISRSVSLSVGYNREPYKTAEPIGVPFGAWTRVGQKNPAVGRLHNCAT